MDQKPEDLSELCFLENITLFVNPKTEPEKYNLYKGLQALSATLREVLLAQRNIEQRLDDILRRK